MHRSLRPRHTYRQNDDDRVLPLVNVVFLLLIFFMIAGQLSRTERFNVQPPESRSEQAEAARIHTVEVSAEGRLALDGEVLDEAALASRAARLREAGEGDAIRLKADGASEARRVVKVMAILRDAGIERVNLVARRLDQ